MRTQFTVTEHKPRTQSFSKLISAFKSDKVHNSKDHLTNALLQSNFTSLQFEISLIVM